MKKVLILGVAAVQMDAIAQLNRMGCETWAAAMAMDGPGARIARHFDQINILDEPKLQAHILRHLVSGLLRSPLIRCSVFGHRQGLVPLLDGLLQLAGGHIHHIVLLKESFPLLWRQGQERQGFGGTQIRQRCRI